MESVKNIGGDKRKEKRGKKSRTRTDTCVCLGPRIRYRVKRKGGKWRETVRDVRECG